MKASIRLSSPELKYVAWSVDICLIAAIGKAVYIAYHDTFSSWPSIYTNLVFAVGVLLLIFGDGLYRSWRVTDIGVLLRTVTKVWVAIFVTLALGLFITKTSNEVSRAWLVIWAFCCWAGFAVERIIVYQCLRWLRSNGYNYRSVILIGSGLICNEVREIVNKSKWAGIKIIGETNTAELEGFLQGCRERRPNEVWICIPMSQENEIRLALHSLRHSTMDIRLVPDVFTLKLINHGVSNVLGIPMLDLSISPINSGMRLAKEIEDKLLAFVILLLVTPVMCLIAIGIKLSSRGPIFFVQKRWGWNGEEINVYKFRTMVKHHEASGSITQATIDDARITPLGAFLRRTSLDELPQFFNVLQGRMSIVGPRPHAVAHNEYYKDLVPGYMLRYKVKPGITGWAQVNGYRGETDTVEKMQKRVEMDLFYIENMSIWFDLQIIFGTVFKIFGSKNAY